MWPHRPHVDIQREDLLHVVDGVPVAIAAVRTAIPDYSMHVLCRTACRALSTCDPDAGSRSTEHIPMQNTSRCVFSVVTQVLALWLLAEQATAGMC